MAFSAATWPAIALVVLLMPGLFAAFAATASSSGCVVDMPMVDRFRQWQATHNRSYASAEERLRRFEVYRGNLEYIDATNRRGGLTYELGENQFADLTQDEFLARYTPYYNPTDDSVITTTTASSEADWQWSSGAGDNHSLEAPPPASVDWRAKGAVTPVKNQSSECSSCWAFVVVATMESLHFLKTGKLVPLSVQQLVDCDKYDEGCNPSQYTRGFQWAVDNGGLTTEAEYPYKAARGTCDRAKSEHHAASISGQAAVPYGDEQALQRAVAGQPVAVSIEVKGMQFYKSGVYSGPCGTQTAHAVTVVGYGADASSGVKYWLVKNSWGQTWGESGYVRMRRDVGASSGLCGIALYGAYPTK